MCGITDDRKIVWKERTVEGGGDELQEEITAIIRWRESGKRDREKKNGGNST